MGLLWIGISGRLLLAALGVQANKCVTFSPVHIFNFARKDFGNSRSIDADMVGYLGAFHISGEDVLNEQFPVHGLPLCCFFLWLVFVGYQSAFGQYFKLILAKKRHGAFPMQHRRPVNIQGLGQFGDASVMVDSVLCFHT